jgi:hypothetical protein
MMRWIGGLRQGGKRIVPILLSRRSGRSTDNPGRREQWAGSRTVGLFARNVLANGTGMSAIRSDDYAEMQRAGSTEAYAARRLGPEVVGESEATAVDGARPVDAGERVVLLDACSCRTSTSG